MLNTNGADTAPNFAEVHILDDRVRVQLEIDFPDYPAFVPGSAEALAETSEPDPAQLSKATGQAFTVRDGDGRTIAPEVRVIEIRDRTPRRVAAMAPRTGNNPAPPERGGRVIYAELDYPLTGQPARLTLAPPLSAQGLASVNLGFIAYHGKVPVTDYRFLSQPEAVRLDWEDPWYTAFDNPNLRRHHQSAIMSFLTIAPREVRHEIIFRLRDLDDWTDLDLAPSEKLDRAQIKVIEAAAVRHFEGLPPLLIDGKEVHPSSVTAMFLEVGAAGVTPIEDPQDLDRNSALMGVILSYPHSRLPESVDMTWELFTDAAQRIPVGVTDPAGPVPDWATPNSPKISWKNFLKTWSNPEVSAVKADATSAVTLPVLSMALFAVALAFLVGAVRRPSARLRWGAASALAIAGAALTLSAFTVSLPLSGAPNREATKKISQAILTNAATAMLETEDAAFTTTLSAFVPPDELQAVGAEMRRGLSVTLPTGARALTDEIEDVTIEKIEPRDGGIDVLARWTANMSGGHWGHQHRQRIRYRGLLDLEETDGVWKLRGLTVLDASTRP
ncbi:MAG: hypothetical protein QNJ62_00580 [Methyloceanibacter sp.]|nr:hypothetical protein [Methyloceanibacter sp.]